VQKQRGSPPPLSSLPSYIFQPKYDIKLMSE
jgi:hypothetical protein